MMKNCEQLEHLFLIHACMLPQECGFERFEILPATVFGNFSSSSSFGSLISPLHSHHHGKNLNLKLFTILSFSSLAKLYHSPLNDAILCWILLPFHENPLRRYFPSSCFSYFFPFLHLLL